MTLEEIEAANHAVPLMRYADERTIKPWTMAQMRQILASKDSEAVEERLARMPVTGIEATWMFRDLVKRFGFSGVELEIVRSKCPIPPCAARDFAIADLRSGKVTLARRALELGSGQVLGLLAHELGHLADPTPEKHGRERRADALALKLAGVEIHYDRCDVQTAGPGQKRRPDHLHQ